MEERGRAISRFLTSATKIEASEIKATLLSFSFIFLLMVAYNMLKPARDALAPEWSDVEVAWLWTINFILSVIAVSLYGWFVSKAKLKNVVPAVYAFFAASFVVFYLGTGVLSDSTYLNKAFYVWLSLFSLFHVSVFWSLMSDLFSKDQAPRLFAFIASGASIGTIVEIGRAHVRTPSRRNLVCRLLLEKKNQNSTVPFFPFVFASRYHA